MRKAIPLLFITFWIPLNICLGQQRISQESISSHLEKLKDGVLLIRLNNIDEKVTELKNSGYKTRALQEDVENKETNEMIINSFKNLYNFSNYYFYNSRDAKAILNGDYQKLFINSKGELANANLEGKDIYSVEYGYASPPGSSGRYNSEGLLVKAIEDGELVRLNGKIFYQGAGFFLNTKKTKIKKSVKKMNYKYHVKYKSYQDYINNQ